MSIENKQLALIISESIQKILSENEMLSLAMAKKIAAKAEQKAKELNLSVCIAITDHNGNLILFHKMNGGLEISVQYAQDKAYTAAVFKAPSHQVPLMVTPEKELESLLRRNHRVTLLEGGYPIYAYKKMIGAIGISGGNGEQDTLIALESASILGE